jgi:hypothetical protein
LGEKIAIFWTMSCFFKITKNFNLNGEFYFIFNSIFWIGCMNQLPVNAKFLLGCSHLMQHQKLEKKNTLLHTWNPIRVVTNSPLKLWGWYPLP